MPDHAQLRQHPAGPELQGRGVAPDRIRPATRRAMGHIRVQLQRHRHAPGLSVPRVRRARPGLQARTGRRPGHRAVCQRAGVDRDAARSMPQPADAGRQGLSRRLRLLRGHRLHPDARATGQASRHRALVHGASPGHEPAGLCACIARPADAAPLHVGPAGAGNGIAAAGARAEDRRDAAAARGRSERRRPSSRRGHRRDHARVHRAEHPDPRGSPAVQRTLPRRGDPRRRQLQPLERPRRHPLARGRHGRLLGHFHLPARPRQRTLLVDRAPADAAPCRSLRSDLRAGARRIPAPRPGDRNAHRDLRFARRRRRDPPRHAHQPVVPAPSISRSPATPRSCWRR